MKCPLCASVKAEQSYPSAKDGSIIPHRWDISCECANFRIDSRLVGNMSAQARLVLKDKAKKQNLAGGMLEITEPMVKSLQK